MNIEFFKVKFLILAAATLFSLVMTAAAQTTVFTYQGKFTDSTLPQPTNSSYEMQYKLFDAAQVGAGNQIGATQTVSSVAVVNGIFTVQLDFGGTVFRSVDLFVEIGVRPVGSAVAFTILAPRQQITTAPLAIRSRIANSAELADNSDALGGIPANQYVQTNDARLSDARNPLAGSPNYIQNQTAVSQAANFNIGGNGIIVGNFGVGGTITGNGANITSLNAGNITTGTLLTTRGGTGLTAPGASGNILQSNGTVWTSAPFQVSNIPAGSGNYIQNSTLQQTSSNFNVSGNGTVGGTFSANIVNSTTSFRIGGVNVFSTPNATSVVAGQLSNYTLLGANSAFFGYKAGQSANSFSQANTFIGSESGELTTSGGNNSFVGANAGFFNTSGSLNSFFGSSAGKSNTTANANSFFGYESGLLNSTGTRNSFFGFQSGRASQTVNDNSFFGYQAGTATTGGGNSFFGSLAGSANNTGSNNSFFGNSAGAANNSGANNSFFGDSAGLANNSGSDNAFFGNLSGLVNTGGFQNTFVGSNAGKTNTNGSSNTFLGYNSGSNTGNSNTFIGENTNGFGNSNTVIGAGADSGGNFSTVIGAEANSIGNNNTAIGNGASVKKFDLMSPAPTFATAIGAGAIANFSNSVVIGRETDFVKIPGDLSVSGSVNAQDLNAQTLTITGGLVKLTTLVIATNTGNKPLCRNANSFVSLCQNLTDTFSPVLKEQTARFEAQAKQIKEQQTNIAEQAEQIKQMQIQIEALKQIVCAMNPAAKICVK